MIMDKTKALEVVNHGDGIISVTLTREDVRPETLPGTRQFLIEAISAKGGRRAMVVDVSQLTYEDMVNGLQYRNGLTARNDLNSLYAHNQASGLNPALINELRYLDNTLQLQAKPFFVAGINETTRKLMHKAKIDRQVALRDTLEEAVEEARGPLAEAHA